MSCPLLHEQRLAGGVLPDEETVVPGTYRFCRPLVVHFGDPLREYEAARSAAAVFDLSDRTQIEMVGGDRQHFLHNFCTNDVKRLESGESCEAFVTDVKARILAHVFIFAGEESFRIETVPKAEASLIAHFEKYVITEDVRLQARTADFGELLLAGPRSRDHLAALGVDVESLQVHEHVTVDRDACRVSVRRVDLLAEPGFLLSTARSQLVGLWKKLIAAGATPGGAVAFHACRIESGFPLYGLDLGADNLAPEAARTQSAISFSKGCYLGQEPIARIDALGHVNRELCSLRLESAQAPESGDAILSDEGLEVGTVTSSALSPDRNRPIALGFVRNEYAATDTVVHVRVGDSRYPAVVARRDRSEVTR